MATGRLGVADLAAGANTVLYTVPANNFSIVSVNMVNRGYSAVAVRVAVCSTTTPADSEWIEYDLEVLSKGVLERTGIAMSAGQILIVYSSAVSVNAVCFGIETSTA
ncbi:uncharacterized protein METZ01_LOCUS134456 [marine metagenome]|uniref:Uncharacterized protein n=1 Tax=marine metagenome TaxID=408172 RepID=A0A381YY92_9ZZZZ